MEQAMNEGDPMAFYVTFRNPWVAPTYNWWQVPLAWSEKLYQHGIRLSTVESKSFACLLNLQGGGGILELMQFWNFYLSGSRSQDKESEVSDKFLYELLQ